MTLMLRVYASFFRTLIYLQYRIVRKINARAFFVGNESRLRKRVYANGSYEILLSARHVFAYVEKGF